ncbi:unnamed protein product [Darwinula stevensoni]|uniref:Uncharacterized protein n=1 Tax=Darwinula stevensoni TaxID=69355 RepID=A0A7R9A8W5_9CRUS|nr:unnamed protein product [Darwinula stevensoni]CAG0896817.1 unnamed protein product [Darwinula stevensoni]
MWYAAHHVFLSFELGQADGRIDIYKVGNEKCKHEGEGALEKFRFNLERKDWVLEKDFPEEGITIKSVYDEETKDYFLYTVATFDFENDWLAQDMLEHSLDATAEWSSDCKELTVVRVRPNCVSWEVEGFVSFLY